jgi:bacterioferritin-associated ferredoxin
MASTLTPDPAEIAPPRPMTRCECASMSFEEIARRMQTQRITLGECARRTGCGQTCTACLPDLQAFLSARQDR